MATQLDISLVDKTIEVTVYSLITFNEHVFSVVYIVCFLIVAINGNVGKKNHRESLCGLQRPFV